VRADATYLVLLARGREIARWPLPVGERPDLELVDALARCELTARRIGYEVRVRGAGSELVDLLEFVGLRDLLIYDDDPLEVRGQPECLEQSGVEEVVQPDDPIV
jgi:hypothetical protein